MQITNNEAKNKIHCLKKEISVKGLKVPVKKTNLFHKELKRIHKVYEPNKYFYLHSVYKKYSQTGNTKSFYYRIRSLLINSILTKSNVKNAN